MKKILLFVGLLLMASGCEKGSPDKEDIIHQENTYAYTENFIIDNRTDANIVITNNTYPKEMEWSDMVIGSDESEKIIQYAVYAGPCFFEELLKDGYPDGEIVFLKTDVGTQLFSITIGGKKLPDDVWLRKHWVYTPGYHDWTYTLTVTDELLERVGFVE